MDVHDWHPQLDRGSEGILLLDLEVALPSTLCKMLQNTLRMPDAEATASACSLGSWKCSAAEVTSASSD